MWEVPAMSAPVKRSWCLSIITFLTICVLAMCAFVTGACFTMPPADAATGVASNSIDILQEKPGTGPEKSTLTFYGMGDCRGCHLKGFEATYPLICRCKEIEIWERDDKHRLAYEGLTGDIAKRMHAILRPKEEFTKSKECLTCHSVWEAQLPGSAKKLGFKLEEGVSCVACHGADKVVLDKVGLPTKSWVQLHGLQPEIWRKLPRDYKQQEFGMIDLWDPVQRTRVCASCHIGNAKEGKVVTHEMYAAGHPPLPNFEVVSFCDQMPRHWEYLGEKDKKILDDVLKLSPIAVQLEQTHLLTLGGLTAFQEYLKLFAAQPEGQDWPDFASYSCYACHHDLKQKSWRQERGYLGRPGRPPMYEWPSALVGLGLVEAAGNRENGKQLITQFHSRLMALQGAVDAQPFGRQDLVQKHAGELIQWVDDQIASIRKRIALGENAGGYTADISNLLRDYLQDLCKASQPGAKLDGITKQRVPDYDTARQLAWAYQVLYVEAKSKHDPGKRKEIREAIEKDEAWKNLDNYLDLTLSAKGTKRLQENLGQRLERIGRYEPKEYFQKLDAILSDKGATPKSKH
jgi:hypothetical protein